MTVHYREESTHWGEPLMFWPASVPLQEAPRWRGKNPPLLERECELAVIAQRLAAVSDGAGGLLMVEGAAGIGKCGLLQAACLAGRCDTGASARAGWSAHRSGEHRQWT
jgi:hypothetical protein